MSGDPASGPGAGGADGRRAVAWALAAILLWGTLAAAVGDALATVRGNGLLFWSLAFAAPSLLAIDLLRGRSLGRIYRAPPRIVLLGLWGILGYHALLFASLERAPIVQANLLNYLWPLFMVLLAAPLAGERPGPLTLGGAVAGFAGAAVVVLPPGESFEVSPRHALGYGFAALAALAWSSFSVLLKRAGPEGEDRMTLFVTSSLPPAFLLALATGELSIPDARALAALAWVGIGTMAVAFFCWSRAVSLGSAARLGTLSYLTPLLSTLCVAAFLGKPITRATWAGMALIVGGAAAPALLARRRA